MRFHELIYLYPLFDIIVKSYLFFLDFSTDKAVNGGKMYLNFCQLLEVTVSVRLSGVAPFFLVHWGLVTWTLIQLKYTSGLGML